MSLDKVAVLLSWVDTTKSILDGAEGVSKYAMLEQQVNALKLLCPKNDSVSFVSNSVSQTACEGIDYAVFVIDTKHGRRVAAGIVGITRGDVVERGLSMVGVHNAVARVSNNLGLPLYNCHHD